MKKFLSLIFAILLSFSFVACGGGGGSSNGSKISGKEAATLLSEIKTAEESTTVESITKFTYNISINMDGNTTYAEHRYSRDDNFFYYAYSNFNLDPSSSSNGKEYLYVNNAGQLIEADYTSGTDYETKSEYSIKKDVLEESVAEFQNYVLVEISEILVVLFDYSSQIFQSVEPVIELGNFSYGGMKLTVKSQGKGHIYMNLKMSGDLMEGMSMNYICEYTNYMLSYCYMDMISSDPKEMGFTRMTTEINYRVNECKLTYPNLDNYEKV